MTSATTDNILTQFHWTPQPEAERLIKELVDAFLERCPYAHDLARRMTIETGTRFRDWIDHIAIAPTPELRGKLLRAGYDETDTGIFRNRHGIFPPVIFCDALEMEVALKVGSVIDFVATNQSDPVGILSDWFDSERSAVVSPPTDLFLSVVERHGIPPGGTSSVEDRNLVWNLPRHSDAFRTRRRLVESDEEGFSHAQDLINWAIDDIGRDRSCDLFFAAEREYWMRRNHAAQVQYARQQRLGLGWANHDHHTYRSSRRHFARLISIFEKLGFQLRERFYAGREAGWGAQVLEQPNAGIVIFADVDLSPDELMIDFAHEPLPERDRLGTVGLWCALHGESFLEAGMHHLECQFDFDALKRQLESEAGVRVMKPFTDFPYLRQAFTEGERWPVRPQRIDRLLKAGLITSEQAEKFRTEGAIGSHLENLERNQGFKGFNQTGVSEIISATDPRKQ